MTTNANNSGLNLIFYGKCAAQWFEKHGLTPDKWQLPESEYTRIVRAKIRITIFYSPASTLEVTTQMDSCSLIACNATLLNENIIDKAEFIAVVLHELGHVINKPDSAESALAAATEEGGDEYPADDYARHCGYGRQIVSSLEKLLVAYPKSFMENPTANRIARIRQDKELLLNASIAPRSKL